MCCDQSCTNYKVIFKCNYLSRLLSSNQNILEVRHHFGVAISDINSCGFRSSGPPQVQAICFIYYSPLDHTEPNLFFFCHRLLYIFALNLCNSSSLRRPHEVAYILHNLHYYCYKYCGFPWQIVNTLDFFSLLVFLINIKSH